MNKLTIEEVEKIAVIRCDDASRIACQLADVMRENARMLFAIGMLADESLSPKQRRNIIAGFQKQGFENAD